MNVCVYNVNVERVFFECALFWEGLESTNENNHVEWLDFIF